MNFFLSELCAEGSIAGGDQDERLSELSNGLIIQPLKIDFKPKMWNHSLLSISRSSSGANLVEVKIRYWRRTNRQDLNNYSVRHARQRGEWHKSRRRDDIIQHLK